MGFKTIENINYNLFIKNYTPESVYILGLIWADGYVSKKTNSITVECIKNDIDIFFPIFQKTGNYNLYYRQRKNRQEQGIINVSSFNLSNFLKENDYLLKSKLSPNKILSLIPNELKNYFFRGWVDGDGCFYINEKTSASEFVMSGSFEQDWVSLTILCESLNINYKITNIITNSTNKHSRFLIKKKQDVVKLGEYLYQGKNFGLQRKYNKFLLIKEKINKTKILCLDLDGTLVKNFDSLKLASIWLNKNRNVSGDISDCIKNRQKTAFGYKWEKIKI